MHLRLCQRVHAFREDRIQTWAEEDIQPIFFNSMEQIEFWHVFFLLLLVWECAPNSSFPFFSLQETQMLCMNLSFSTLRVFHFREDDNKLNLVLFSL